jgi:hypothetical protein
MSEPDWGAIRAEWQTDATERAKRIDEQTRKAIDNPNEVPAYPGRNNPRGDDHWTRKPTMAERRAVDERIRQSREQDPRREGGETERRPSWLSKIWGNRRG